MYFNTWHPSLGTGTLGEGWGLCKLEGGVFFVLVALQYIFVGEVCCGGSLYLSPCILLVVKLKPLSIAFHIGSTHGDWNDNASMAFRIVVVAFSVK